MIASENRSLTYKGFITVFGLFLTLVLVPLLPFISKMLQMDAVLFEILEWAFAFIILFLVVKGEGLPLKSIGLIQIKSKDILWGVGLGLLLFIIFPVVTMIIGVMGLQINTDMAAKISDKPLYFIFLITLRAGVTEEILYRGYPMERLISMLGNKWLAALIPLSVFVISHLNWGWGHLIFVTIAGGILTVVYMWKRNLWINIIGHFLVDFMAFMIVPYLLELS